MGICVMLSCMLGLLSLGLFGLGTTKINKPQQCLVHLQSYEVFPNYGVKHDE